MAPHLYSVRLPLEDSGPRGFAMPVSKRPPLLTGVVVSETPEHQAMLVEVRAALADASSHLLVFAAAASVTIRWFGSATGAA